MTRRRALAADRAWPVSSAQLRVAFGALLDQVKVVWMTWDQRTLADPLSVSWTPRSDGIGSKPTQDRVTIWVRPVAKSDHEVAARLIAATVLPDLASWIDKALQSSEVWQDARHERSWSIHGQLVDTHDDDGMHIVDRDRG